MEVIKTTDLVRQSHASHKKAKQLLEEAKQKVEPPLEELKEVFKKAKEKGAIVAGEWFEKNNQPR
jgi:hypothetical protein